MRNLLQFGSDWLGEKLQQYASHSVLYQRGAEEVAVPATIGRTLLKLDDGYAVRMEWTDRDFLIPTAELILGGQSVLPERGDRIRESQDGKVFIYEVMAPGREPVWRWSDLYRKMLRIHTKQIGVE